MLPKFRGVGTPKEKTVAISADAAIDPVIDWAWAAAGRASMPSAARRRSERFTEELLVVVIDGGMITSIAFRRVGLVRSLLLHLLPHQGPGDQFLCTSPLLVSCQNGPARL